MGRTASLGKARIEIGLLACLEALLIERSVTGAARRVGMTQPGMSNALARLRVLTNDPLMVRRGNIFELTPRAVELVPFARSGLAMLEEIFGTGDVFDPRQASDIITISMTESLAMLLAPGLLSHFDQHAPHLQLNIQQFDPLTVSSLLSEGHCDIALGYLHTVPEQMYATSLLSQSVSVIQSAERAQSLPVAGLDLAAYASLRHLFLHGPNVPHAWPEASISESLRALGHSRRVGMHVNSLLLAPELVARSSMLCTMPTWLARRAALSAPIVVHPLPWPAPPITAHLIWHERTHRRPLGKWLRNAVKSVVAHASTRAVAQRGVPLFD